MDNLEKLRPKVFYALTLLSIGLLLVGCSESTAEEDPSEKLSVDQTEQVIDDREENESEEKEEESKTDTKEDTANDEKINSPDSKDNVVENKGSSENSKDEKVDDNKLNKYSSEEIEYARVWLQLGPNQDIEELNVYHIPAGTLLNPDEDDIDVRYTEDVIQLRGSRIVDGIVTYSGNGDGSINVYNIPHRWYGGTPRPNDIDKDKIIEERKNIITNTKLVYVDPGDDESVIKLINKIKIN